jgi:hypothetical protein
MIPPNETAAALTTFLRATYELAWIRDKWLPDVVQVILFYLLDAPLLYLYLYGPSFMGIGFWGGRPFEDICAAMTGVSSGHWFELAGRCQSIIKQRFDSFLVLLYVPLFYVVLFALVRRFCLCRCPPGIVRK